MSEIVLAWTDGACLGNPGPGGWAALLRIGTRERELVGGEAQTTNNRMELMGAIAALEALKRPVKIKLHSDSQYVIKGMKEWLVGWKKRGYRTAGKKPVLNRDLWERLDQAAQPHEVEWLWVKGHAGHVENERVDQLANTEALRQKSGAGASEVAPKDTGDDGRVSLALAGQVEIGCKLAGTPGAARKAPDFCVKGPGNVGVHCVVGDGSKICQHARLSLARGKIAIEGRPGDTATLEAAERLHELLSALTHEPSARLK